MRPVSFSHTYRKMCADVLTEHTYLIGLQKIDIEKLPEGFLKYDSEYSEMGKTGWYELPKGEVLVLLLYTVANGVWTTIRSYNEEKYEYYKSLIGERVQIIIK